MAIPSLLGSYIDQTYQRLVQTTGSGTEFADGLGNPITFGTINTGSFLITASVVSNIITFKKGDGSTFPITVNTGSGGGVTFPYTGSATITGSLIVTGSTTSTLGFTGSLQGTASYVSGSVFGSTNPALSASFATTASRAISSSFATTASYALNARAGGTNTQLQYNRSGSLTGVIGLTWETGSSNFLVNNGYYVMDFPINSGGGFLGRGSNNLLFQMGFNAAGQYGGTAGTISGNQFFVYNFQGPGGAANYYWGFNNTGDNYWGSSNTRYSVKIQQPIITPDEGNIIPLEIKLDNTDSDNTDGFNSHLVLNNPNEFGQNSITSIINGAVVAKWRTDYVGNINWAAGSGGSHAFYTDGDFGVGQSRMCIFNNGNVLIKNSGVGGANIDSGFKLDVNGTGRFASNLQITGSVSEGNGTYAIGNYSHAEGFKTSTGLYAYQSTSISGGTILLNSSYGDVSDQFIVPLSIVLDDSAVDNIYGRQIFSVDNSSWDGTNTKINLVDTSVTTTQANIGVIGIINPTNADLTIGGTYAHTEGIETLALANNQHVQGQYNIPTLGGSAFIIGNGANNANRSNLLYAAGTEVQITGSLKIKGSDNFSLPIAEFTNNSGYSIQILATDENLSSGYSAPKGSIGSSNGILQLKYGAADYEWGNFVYQDNNGVVGLGVLSLSDLLVLPPQDPLPTDVPTGSFAVSGSGANCKPYFYNGSTWTPLF